MAPVPMEAGTGGGLEDTVGVAEAGLIKGGVEDVVAVVVTVSGSKMDLGLYEPPLFLPPLLL